MTKRSDIIGDMQPLILNGKELAKIREENIKNTVFNLKTKPTLTIIQVGDNKESNKYIEHKKSFGMRVGINVDHFKFKENISEKKLIEKISELNQNNNIHGTIVQLPLPKNLTTWKILDTISPLKDVDGMTSVNLRKLYENNEWILPATTKGIITLLESHKIKIAGKHIVIIGRSSLVGKPTSLAFINRDATVTICHSRTKKLKEITCTADILITAIGKPEMINNNYIKEKCVVVDVGITVKKTKIVGDTKYKSLIEKVSAITPVPGGVGPMTIVSLFENLLIAHKKTANK